MSEFSRETLLNIIETDHVQCGEASALARMALAAMDSEPVAEVVSIYGDPEDFGEREIRPLVGIQQMPYGTKLYRHAQQPVVPASQKEPISFDEWSRKCALQITLCCPDFREKAKYIWDSARETQQPAPVVPDGYVMVPKEPTDEMIAAAMNCEDVLFNSDDSFCVQFVNIYEAMLAAAPQEDKK